MNEILQKALDYINSTEAFLKEQVPDFVVQYLTWCSYECIFYIVLFSIFFAVPFVAFLIINHKISDKDFDYEGPSTSRGILWLLSLIVTIIMGLVACINIPINSYTLLKITKAPKVFLVERLADQLKK